MRWLVSVGLGLSALLLSHAAAAQFDGPETRSDFATHAAAVWAAVPDTSRLAVRPVRPDESGLAEDIAKSLDAALLRALDRARPAAATILPRGALQPVFEEAEAFGGRDPADLLTDVSATALAIPRAVPTAFGLRVELSVLSVEGRGLGGLLTTMPSLHIAFSPELAGLRPPSIAAQQAGTALAESLRASLDPAGAFNVTIIKPAAQGEFAEWFAAQLGEHLAARLGETPLYVSRPLRDLDTSDARLKVRLAADVWDLGDRVDVTVVARAGSVQAQTVARIPKRTVPAGFLPLTRSGGRVGAGMLRATGAAQAGAGLRTDELPFAAQAVARARIIDAALGGQHSVTATARTRADLVAALRRLEAAIPHEEILRTAGSAERRTSSISARIERVGEAGAPQISASLDRAAYVEGLPIRLRLQMARSSGFLGLFALQADGSVVRVLPSLGGDAVRLEGGREIMLPRPQDGEISSAPMPEVADNLEALVLLVSAFPFDPRKLAPMLGTRAEDSVRAGISLGAFLDRLAQLDLARSVLRVLPYQVRRDDG